MRFACVRIRTNSSCISTCKSRDRICTKRPDLRALFFVVAHRARLIGGASHSAFWLGRVWAPVIVFASDFG